ncbi:MAG: lytic murein transglycosylase [Oligoflexus sp.]
MWQVLPKPILLIHLLILSFPLLMTEMGHGQSFSSKEIDMLINSTVDEVPWSKTELKKIFSHQQLKKLPETVKLNVTEPLRLSEERYKHFTEPYALNLARKFSRRWRTTLRQAAEKYAVDSEVIVAVMLVETSFGRFKGDYHLLSIFSSTHVESNHMMAKDDYKELPEAMQARIKQRAEWSRQELIALLKMAKKHPRIKPFELRGSYAGAFGKSQFLPSSYMRFAVRARDKASPDLFFEPDAIYSIANYLKGHGYQRSLDREENREALFAYNRSQVYVNVVLAVAQELKK